jgi:putative hydrolase of the HAD superfamily
MGPLGVRYDAVFLDVDGTLLYVDLDVGGYVEDLTPYTTNGPLSVEAARGPVWEGFHEHIRENIKYPSTEELARFRRDNARRTARALGLDAPDDVLVEVSRRRISFNPYPESEEVLEELARMRVPLYAVSNWDVELEAVLDDLGWRRFFDDLVVSAKVGVEKPDDGIFERALEVAGVGRERAVMVGNDPVSDVRGAARAGIDAVLVDRRGKVEALEAVAVLQDLRGLPALVAGG